MATHTPGPWKASTSQPLMVFADDEKGRWIAELNPYDNGTNARLIAAAPDLLAACENAESALDSKKAVGYLAHDRTEYALRVIRAAIAKAHGK
jgi:hypothetical protein